MFFEDEFESMRELTDKYHLDIAPSRAIKKLEELKVKNSIDLDDYLILQKFFRMVYTKAYAFSTGTSGNGFKSNSEVVVYLRYFWEQEFA